MFDIGKFSQLDDKWLLLSNFSDKGLIQVSFPGQMISGYYYLTFR